MQGDGNLVLYRNDNGPALWASGTLQKPVTYAVMQGDGNVVCYDSGGKPYWASGTDGHSGAYLALQDDGNLVVYSANNTSLWASNTVQNWDPMIVDTGDSNIGTGMWMHSGASLAASGLISGHTHTWCTVDLRSFPRSVVVLPLDANNKVIWPPNPQVTKRQYGVDGVWIGTHDRAVWSLA